jgi:hypothetical protein
VEATERLRRQLPAAAVIALTTYSDDSWSGTRSSAGSLSRGELSTSGWSSRSQLASRWHGGTVFLA